MATPSSALAATYYPITFLPTNEKLTKANFASWRAQVVSALNGYQLGKYILPGAEPPSKFLETKPGTQIDSKEPPAINPEYEIWIAKDQQVLNYLLSNMSKEILGQVNHEVTASAAGQPLKGCFRRTPGRASLPPGWPSPPPQKVPRQFLTILAR